MKYIQSQPIEFTDPDIGRSSSGHKFHNWITGLYLSKLLGMEYVYSPFTQDAERYEQFLNLHTGWKPYQAGMPIVQLTEQLDFCHDPSTPHLVYSDTVHKLRSVVTAMPDNTVLRLPPNPLPGLLTQFRPFVVNELRNAYWAIPRESSRWWDPNRVNIAIHIRRGDITNQRNPDRWLDLIYYEGVVELLFKDYPQASIVVFSEGDPHQFESLERMGAKVVLGGADLPAFHHMALADVLVTGQSSWSIMASYFNRGAIRITPLKNFMYNWDLCYNVELMYRNDR